MHDERAHLASELIAIGRLLHQRGIYSGKAGNMSARLSDGRLLVTRSSRHKGLLTADDFMLIAPDGAALKDGTMTSEGPLHLAAYRARPDIGAVLHAHPPACTTLARLGQALDGTVSEEGRLMLGVVPLLPPAEAGDPAGAARWGAALAAGAQAALLAGHGVVVVGRDVRDAFARLETCEFLAEVQWRLRLAR